MPKKATALKVKYERDTHTIKCDLKSADALETLKAQIMTLTNVPVDRQKIFLKGKQLTAEALAGLKKNAKLMMTGSAEKLAEAPKVQMKFVEDMTPAELAALAPESIISAGLNNLGNTCFMNSTMQCFRSIKEFKQGMQRHSRANQVQRGDLGSMLCYSWGQLYTQMDSTQEPVTPFAFTESMRRMFPQLGTRDEKSGNYQQQDADECLVNILSAVKQNVRDENKISLADKLFTGQFTVEMKGMDAGEEKVTNSVDTFTKLQCFIDGKINFMNAGIHKGLTEQIERRDSLGNPAVFTRTSKIKELPKVLIVQFVRFYYNATKQQKSKILRKVSFPERLDAIEFCDAEKKASLLAARQKLKVEEDLKLGIARKKAKVEEKKEEKESKDDMDIDAKEAPLPTDSSGIYELTAVVTHQGRSADSGHYIGWARKSEGSDEWWKFDDHVVTEVKTEDIQSLCGGADWHINYISFYRRIDNLVDKVWQDVPAEKVSEQKS